jgi:PAS domain S-box-containing protein
MKNETKPISRQKKQGKAIPEKIRPLKKVNKRNPLTAMFWQSSLDAVTDAVCFLDIDQRILHCNRAMTKMFGLTQKEIIGKHCWEVVHGTSKPILKCPSSRAKKSLARENVEIRKGDRYFNIIADPIVDKKGKIKGVVHTLQDITAQKHTVQSLQESENKYRELMENISEVIFSVDIDGCITYISPAMTHLTGYSTNEITGTNMTEHIIPEDLPNVLASIKRILANGQEEAIEYRVKIKNGEIRYVVSSSNIILKNGQPAGLTGVITDITHRKLAEEALKDAELKFKKIFDSASDGILLVGSGNREFISANEKMCAMLDYTKEELLNLNFSDIHPKESLPYVMDQFEKLSSKEISIVHDIPVMRKDKTVFFADVNSSSIILDGKECLIGMFRDTTERQKAEEELRESEKKYKLLTEQMSDIVWIMDLNLQTIYVSPSIQKVLGFTREERLHQNVSEQLTPDSLSIATEVLESELALEKQGELDPQKTKTLILEFYHKDGSTRWLESIVNGLRNEQGVLTGLHGVSRDITERKRAEEALKERDIVFKKLSINVPGIIYQFMMKPDGTFCVPFSTDAVKDLYGCSHEEIVNDFSPIAKVIYHEDTERFIDSIKRSAKNMSHWQCEYRVQVPGKPLRWLLGNSTPEKLPDGSIIWHGFNTDITERKQAEAEIAILSNALKLALDPILILDLEGKVINANEAAKKLFETEDLGISALDYVAPEDKEKVSATMQALMMGSSVNVAEFTVISKSGRRVFIEATGNLIADENGKATGLVVVERDISERKRMEEALRESETKLKAVIQGSPVPQFVIDQHHHIIHWNKALEEISGIKAVDVLGTNKHWQAFYRNERPCLADLLVDKKVERIPELYKEKYNESKYTEGAYEAIDFFPLIGNEGKWLFFSAAPIKDTQGNVIGAVETLQDMTERKKAEENLKQSMLLNEAIINSVPGLLYLYDDTGHLVHWNKQHEILTGYSGEEIKGRYILDWFGGIEPDTSSIKKGIADVTRNGYASAEGRLITKDGNSIFMSFTGVKLNISGRDHLLGIGTDITERKNAAKELEKYRDHLEELVRERTINLEASNKELEAFSYSASHDLRAPLRSIEGFSQALLEDYRDKLDIQGKDYLTRIKTATRRMADLIEDMLQLSRITRMEMNIEKVNLTLIARSVMSELQKSQPQRHVEIRIAENLEDMADLRLMRIVLDNLLSNAWKFTERQANAKIEFGLWKSEGSAKTYFIRDNGAGFDMAYADKLFAPFQRLHADDEFPGTGIGLATVRRIINRHGGKVWAEGEIDKGASFYFIINEK